MSYVKENIIPGEEIIAIGKVSWWTAFWPVIIGIVLAVFTVIGVLVMFPALYRILTTEMAVTNQRIIIKTGFISRKVVALRLNRVEAFDFEQSVSDRILRIGKVTLAGAGNRVTLKDVARVKQFVNQFNVAREKYKG